MTGSADRGAVSRRAALGILAGAAAAVTAAVAGVRVVGDRSAPGDHVAVDGVRRIGEAYLAQHRDESDPERLRTQVPSDPDALAEAIETDFVEDRIVVLDGWHLSLTECRAAALVALS